MPGLAEVPSLHSLRQLLREGDRVPLPSTGSGAARAKFGAMTAIAEDEEEKMLTGAPDLAVQPSRHNAFVSASLQNLGHLSDNVNRALVADAVTDAVIHSCVHDRTLRPSVPWGAA